MSLPASAETSTRNQRFLDELMGFTLAPERPKTIMFEDDEFFTRQSTMPVFSPAPPRPMSPPYAPEQIKTDTLAPAKEFLRGLASRGMGWVAVEGKRWVKNFVLLPFSFPMLGSETAHKLAALGTNREVNTWLQSALAQGSMVDIEERAATEPNTRIETTWAWKKSRFRLGSFALTPEQIMTNTRNFYLKEVRRGNLTDETVAKIMLAEIDLLRSLLDRSDLAEAASTNLPRGEYIIRIQHQAQVVEDLVQTAPVRFLVDGRPEIRAAYEAGIMRLNDKRGLLPLADRPRVGNQLQEVPTSPDEWWQMVLNRSHDLDNPDPDLRRAIDVRVVGELDWPPLQAVFGEALATCTPLIENQPGETNRLHQLYIDGGHTEEWLGYVAKLLFLRSLEGRTADYARLLGLRNDPEAAEELFWEMRLGASRALRAIRPDAPMPL